MICSMNTSCVPIKVEDIQNIIAENGTFSSPGFPNMYPPSMVYVWNIIVPEGEAMEIRFLKFEVIKDIQFI